MRELRGVAKEAEHAHGRAAADHGPTLGTSLVGLAQAPSAG